MRLFLSHGFEGVETPVEVVFDTDYNATGELSLPFRYLIVSMMKFACDLVWSRRHVSRATISAVRYHPDNDRNTRRDLGYITQ